MATHKQRAYSYIRHAMTTGSLVAGDRLSPAALAQKIGISHIPVREAISQLHSEGLVDQTPRRGAFVRQVKRQELIDLIELRKVLECNAAAQAARRATDVALDELEEHLKELHRLRDALRVPVDNDEQRVPLLRDWMCADLNFHMGLLRAAGNQSVIKVLGEANVLTRMFGHRTDLPGAWTDPVHFTSMIYVVHRDIFVAVRRHDAKAARRAMNRHMNRARKNILERFDWLHWEDTAGDDRTNDFPETMRRKILEIERRDIEDSLPSEKEPPTK